MLFGFIVGWFFPSNFWMVFIYVGVVLVMGYLLDSFKIKKDIDFELHVFTRQKDMFTSYNKILNDRLILHDYIPRLDLMETLSRMDFLLNLDNGITVQTPSKLIDYALTKRPILCLNSSDIDEDLLFSFMKV